MGILANIFSKIFPGNHPANSPAAQGAPTAAPGNAAPTVSDASKPAPIDIEAMLTDLASKNPEKLNWRTSIVDLMKLLGLDSSLANRKELAQELHYTGDMNDSASMNIWLHKQVMQKVAANGGKVPADLTN